MKNTIISISTQNGIQFIRDHEIIYCKAQGNYTSVHLNNGSKFMSSKKLKAIEEILDSEHFFRIHHGHLVNLTHIDSYQNGDKQVVLMTNGDTLELSKRKKTAFLSLFPRL